MSAQEIERIVARYLDGAMSPEEEEDFFVRMALDGELRRSYQAHRIVEDALRKQRKAAPPAARAARATLMASIASSHDYSAGPGAPRASHRVVGSNARTARRWMMTLAATIVAGITTSVVLSEREPTVPVHRTSDSTEVDEALTAPSAAADSIAGDDQVVTGRQSRIAVPSPAESLAPSVKSDRSSDANATVAHRATALDAENEGAPPPVRKIDSTTVSASSNAGASDTIKVKVRVTMP